MRTLREEAAELGLSLTESDETLLCRYLDLVLERNKEINLTAIRDRNEAMLKHVVDSLSVARALPPAARTLVDIGAGAGFPGVPLKIARPDLKLTLVESVGKKAAFLKEACAGLGIEACVVNCRAEDAGRDAELRDRFDAGVARAVAGLPTLLEYSLPLIAPGGVFIAQKSDSEGEIANAQNALEALGGKVAEVIPIAIEGLEPRELVVIEKTGVTPPEYPRRTGVPLKRPL